MALLLDGPPSTIEDLGARDSDLFSVSVAEGIDLTSKLRLAAADLGMTIESMLFSTASVLNDMRVLSLEHIAVTQPLRLWHTYATLTRIYQDLYFSRLNDRYQAKMTLYREEESRALESFRNLGVGIVFDPLPQATAPNTGTIATGDPGGSMYVSVSYVNRPLEEGLMSVPVEVDTQDGTSATISVGAVPNNAVGWNLYAGVSPNALTRQNSEPLMPQASLALTPSGLRSGATHEFGQRPNQFLPIPNRLLRG